LPQHKNHMELAEIVKLVDAKVIVGNIYEIEVETGFCSDLMSDVLTIDTDKMLLITGMANLQTIRTAEMADVQCILLVRNKIPTDEMIQLAKESGMVLLGTACSMFRTSGELFKAGLQPVY
jgi:succinyl-CoA synthetase alpha subunit